MSKNKGEAYWRNLVKRFNGRGPGVSLVDFCLEHRVSSGQLYAYRRRFEEEPEAVALPALVPVHVVESQDVAGPKEAGGAVEVAVGTGVVMRFEVGADVTYVAELIAGVSRRLGC